MADVKLIPYGISSFQQVRKENKYYSDKTMFLEKMENAGNFLFLTRPRRFGKSIFLSMMRSYYDINETGRFDELFAGLYVHEHPTKERGKYQVLFLDFSQVGGDSRTAEEKFERYGCKVLDDFIDMYGKYYTPETIKQVKDSTTFAEKLTSICLKARTLGYQLYLIIDEYDNFTNNILNNEGEGTYHELTHATGFYRDIFKLFKPNFTRILMMGVQPVTLDDLTSGYNIATNITLDSDFDTMLGFSENEVRTMIRYYISAGLISDDEDAIIDDMKPWYDNYCFAVESFNSEPKMFNSDMVCYYLAYMIRHGKAPVQRIDPNTMTDYKKLKNLIRPDKIDNRRLDIIHRIAGDGYILGSLNASFPAESMMDDDNFISMLYYYGMLTITGIYGARLELGIPNNNVRLQYYEYLRQEYERTARIDTHNLQDGFDVAAFDGNWHPMIDSITDAYHDNTSVRSLVEGERNVQGFMSAFLSLNPYYLVMPEVEMSHGYCDFFLLPDHSRYPQVAHSYILELKYLKADATDADAERQWNEAEEQIRRYAQDKVVNRLLDGTTLHLIIVQIKGTERLRADELRR